MKAHSLDLRQKIVDTYDVGGVTQRAIRVSTACGFTRGINRPLPQAVLI